MDISTVAAQIAQIETIEDDGGIEAGLIDLLHIEPSAMAEQSLETAKKLLTTLIREPRSEWLFVQCCLESKYPDQMVLFLLASARKEKHTALLKTLRKLKASQLECLTYTTRQKIQRVHS